METENKFKYLHQKKKLIVISIYIMSVVYGVHMALADAEPTINDLILNIVFGFTLTFYCVFDSQIRNKPIPHFSRWLIFFTWPISVPIYKAWSQGKDRILSSVFKILSVPGIILLSIILTSAILQFIDPSQLQ